MSSDDEWVATSYHEAGHAATGFAYDAPLVEVTISDGGGLTDRGGGPRSGIEGLPEEELIGMAVTSFAGPLAEAWYRHQAEGISYGQAEATAFAASNGDMALVQEITDYLGWTRRDLHAVETEARNLVAEYWTAIVDVAEALRDNDGYLSGAEVEGIVLGVAA